MGKNQIMIWFEWILGPVDLIWHTFLITWFDLTYFLNHACSPWFHLNFRNHYRCNFVSKSWIQAKPMTPMERARRELSIGAIFVHVTLISASLWIDFGDAKLYLIWNRNQIWFDLRPSFRLMIWFDLRVVRSNQMNWFDNYEMNSVLCRFYFTYPCKREIVR